MDHALRVRELLAQAVECLDNQALALSNSGRSELTRSGPSSHRRSPVVASPHASSPDHSASYFSSSVPGPSSGVRTSALVERNCLFNFSAKGRQRAASASTGGYRSKKKRFDLWKHDFV